MGARCDRIVATVMQRITELLAQSAEK
jgi:hypothetical protein